jgi:hypothetical protein
VSLQLKKTKKFFNSQAGIFLICGVLASIFFCFHYGIRILNFQYIDWLLVNEHDVALEYLGWEFFRISQWKFPFGLTNANSYPFDVSVIYTGSIPLFSFIFKIFSPILPEKFQYTGLFLLIMHFLQGSIAGILIKKITKNSVFSIIGSLFFTIAPILTYRIFYHDGLAAQFIVLLAIYAAITNNRRCIVKTCIVWSSILSLSVLFHSYFLPMCFIIMSFYLLHDFIINKESSRITYTYASSILCVLLMLYLLGYFNDNTSSYAEGLGLYSANLNFPINPQISYFSTFLPVTPTINTAQEEGLGYLGLGIIISVIISLFIVAVKIKNKNVSKQRYLQFGLIFTMCLVFVIIALSPLITLGKNNWLIPYPEFILQIWSVFRATGRFVWVTVYILMLFSIFCIFKGFKPIAASIILALLFVVQYADVHKFIYRKGVILKHKFEYSNKLNSSIWNKIGNDNRMIFYTLPLAQQYRYFEKLHLYPLSYFAVQNKLFMNENNYSRVIFPVSKYREEEIERILKGDVKDSTIYIFGNLETGAFMADIMPTYMVNNIVFGLKNSKDYLDEYLIAPPHISYKDKL